MKTWKVKIVKQENKSLLIKYLICIGVAVLLTVLVFWMQGFFTDNIAVNVQILADGFCVSGGLMTMVAGIMLISEQGALLGISFIARNFVLSWLIPGGRKKQELYKDYYERKMSQMKKQKDHALLWVGLVFFIVGIVLTVIWYAKFYNVPV